MSTSDAVRTPGADAPLTLTDPPPRTLGLRDALGIDPGNGWSASLVCVAVALTLPVALVGLAVAGGVR